jgi:hypothetical protein
VLGPHMNPSSLIDTQIDLMLHGLALPVRRRAGAIRSPRRVSK